MQIRFDRSIPAAIFYGKGLGERFKLQETRNKIRVWVLQPGYSASGTNYELSALNYELKINHFPKSFFGLQVLIEQ
jgi:hypothetical protein